MTVLFWVLLAIGLAVIEIMSVTFFPIFFTVSAAVAALVLLAGGEDWVQWVVFGIGGLVLSGLVRPIAKRAMDRTPDLPSRIDRLVGRVALVTSPIDGRASVGAVTIDGQVWSAKPGGDGLGAIAAGTDVAILSVNGATLTVEPTKPLPEEHA